MNKFKQTLLALALALCIAHTAGAQTFQTVKELVTPVTRHKPAATYLVAYGKVLAKKTSAGLTRFNYVDGKVTNEVLPNGTVGTYLYDRTGKFEGIAYNDGRTVRVKYSETGKVIGLQSGGPKDVLIRKEMKAAELDKQKLAPFLALQEGLNKLDPSLTNAGDPVCYEGEEEPCVVNAGSFGGGGGNGGGGGSGFDPINGSGGGAVPDPIGSGAGGGGGVIYPNTGTSYPTPEECKANVCEGGKKDMDAYCAVAAKGAENLRRCYSKNMEYYANCLRSCGSGDWSWTESFNFIW
jgi:hypothetical protein